MIAASKASVLALSHNPGISYQQKGNQYDNTNLIQLRPVQKGRLYFFPLIWVLKNFCLFLYIVPKNYF